MRFGIYFLLSLVVCLLATSIWAEVIAAGAASEPPAHLRAELRIFRAIVIPPAYLSPRSLNGAYVMFAAPDLAGSFGGVLYMPRPTRAAFEFLRTGIPFWFLIFLAIGEAGIAALGRRRTRTPQSSVPSDV